MTSRIWEVRLTVISKHWNYLTGGMRVIDIRWGRGLGRKTVSRGHCGMFRRDLQDTALTVAVL